MHGSVEWAEASIASSSRRRMAIPERLKAMTFEELAAEVSSLGGDEVVDSQRRRIERATCSPCGLGAATATLRMWLARREFMESA